MFECLRKIRAALNQFSYDVLKTRVGEAPAKNLCIFGKTIDYYFCVFTIVCVLKVGPRANVFNAFLLCSALLGYLGYVCS